MQSVSSLGYITTPLPKSERRTNRHLLNITKLPQKGIALTQMINVVEIYLIQPSEIETFYVRHVHFHVCLVSENENGGRRNDDHFWTQENNITK